MKSPKVSVIMPVYNSEKYLREAIDSILNQTFTDFEFLIFNDGSSDNSAEIIKGYKDPRIVFNDYKKNSGHIVCLNEGIKIAKGEYIARMDSDDISLPQRLEKQVNFMENNIEVGVCGTHIVTIGEISGHIPCLPVNDEDMKSFLLFNGTIAHPTVIMRKSLLEKYNLLYDQNYYTAEDYKMWVDISRYSKLSNLPDVLLKYRVHSSQITKRDNTILLAALRKIYKQQVCAMGFNPTEKELEIHSLIANKMFDNGSSSWINEAGKWLLKLKEINQQRKTYPEPAFSQVLTEKWLDVCKRRRRFGIWAWKIFIEWPILKPNVRLSIMRSIKVFFESLLIFIKRLEICRRRSSNYKK